MGLLDRPQQAQRYGLLSPDVMQMLQSGGPRVAPAPVAPAAPPQRQRVSGWRVLDRVLGGETISEGLDAERARLQAETMRPQNEARAAFVRAHAMALGPVAEAALALNPEEYGKAMSSNLEGYTLGAGGVRGGVNGQVASAPTFTLANDTIYRNDPGAGTSIPTATAPAAFSDLTARYNAENPTVASGSTVFNLPTGRVVAQGTVPLTSVSVPQGGSAAPFNPATGTYGAPIQGQPERRRTVEDANGVRRYEDDGSAVFPADEVRVRSQARGRLDSATASGTLLLSEIDKAIALTGAGETGIIGAVMGAVPATRAFNLRRTIETIKSNVGFNYLQQMRDLSPTGGALGSLAIQEMQSLQSVLGNLDPDMGEPQLEAVLNQVKAIVVQGQALRERLYNEQFGSAPVPAPAPAGGGVSVEAARAELLRRGVRP
jgi:hypothetical protein